jgi:putative endopeptidase
LIFIQFCNGNWKDEIPETDFRLDFISILQNVTFYQLLSIITDLTIEDTNTSTDAGKLALLWSSAMDLEKIEEVGITPLNDLFEEIDKISSLSDFVKFVAKSHKYGVNILFDIASEAHPENSQRTILWIYEAVFGLPSKEYYFDADKEELRSAYLSFITEILTMAGLENAHTISLEIMALETEIAKAAKSSIEGRDLKGLST